MKINNQTIQIERIWSMPSSNTFNIKPIRQLIYEEIETSNGLWIDAFANESKLASITNDLNPIYDTKSSYWTKHKKEIARIVKPNGKVITFGWNSGGIGMKYGFEIVRILLVPHGGWHNDTICTVNIKNL